MAGASKKACCPFHHEKTPSFNINDNKGYYHAVARIYGVAKDFKPTGRAFLVVDNEMLELTAVPFNAYAMTNDFDPKMTLLDYVLPENVVAKLRNHKTQIGLQVFFDGEKPRILTLIF